MNTREYLIHRLSVGLRGRDPEMIADLILNGRAHELAEEIRELGRIWSSEDVMSAANAIDLHSKPNPCPYTHAHTRHWCGYEQCRDS